MSINVKKTIEYYETFLPCNCGDCRFFSKHIEIEQSDVCDYLKSFGINPVKPYELVSLYNEKEKNIEYFDCAYVVFGCPNTEIEKLINGVEIKSCSKENYPLLDVDDDYFFISIGPVFINCTYVWNRHFTFDDKVQVVKMALDEIDPMGPRAMHCPKNEYLQEAVLIAKEIKNRYISSRNIQNIFKKQFDETMSLKVCHDIENRINSYLDMKDFFKNFCENELIKDKISISNLEITLKVHEKFVVKQKGRNTYINDKFYYDIEEQDLLDCLCEFVEDNDTIYVQYEHYHFEFHFNHSGYFKEIKRSKYSFEKLRHKKDIELIFDNKGIIYSK